VGYVKKSRQSNELTDCMEQSPSDANSHSASQEIPAFNGTQKYNTIHSQGLTNSEALCNIS